MLIKQKAIPILENGGVQVLGDMPRLVFYLYQQFRGEIMMSGYWPKNANVEEIMAILEWYSCKLRPFMWEFYGIMTST